MDFDRNAILDGPGRIHCQHLRANVSSGECERRRGRALRGETFRWQLYLSGMGGPPLLKLRECLFCKQYEENHN
jgi:hypothetical protein